MKIKKVDYAQSLAKGLQVLKAFNKNDPKLTISEVALKTKLSRSSARRFLLTYVSLGYMQTDGKFYRLTPKVLELGYTFISSLNLSEIARPYMLQLTKKLNVTCSIATLDNLDIIFVARQQVSTIMTDVLGIGARLPAHFTSLGRLLLAMNNYDSSDLLDQFTFTQYTAHSIANKHQLKKELALIREKRWALVDQELTYFRSIAVGIPSKDGAVEYAINVSSHSSQSTKEQFLNDFLPELILTSQEISKSLSLLD